MYMGKCRYLEYKAVIKKKKSPKIYPDVLTHLFLLETDGELF